MFKKVSSLFLVLFVILLGSCSFDSNQRFVVQIYKNVLGERNQILSYLTPKNTFVSLESFVQDYPTYTVEKMVNYETGEETTSGFTVTQDMIIDIYMIPIQYCVTLIRHNPEYEMKVYFTYSINAYISTQGFDFSAPEGYMFAGWSYTDSDNVDCKANPGDNIYMYSAKDLSLYAVFKPDPRKTFTVTYENTDSLPEDTVTEFKLGANENDYYYALELPYLKKEGYHFDGWYQEPDFSGECYNTYYYFFYYGDEEIDGLVFYAKWTPLKYYISFYSYNYDCIEKEFDYKETFVFPDSFENRDGYIFLGWGLDCFNALYQPGDESEVPAENVWFYEVWIEKDAHKITYVLNYGESDNVMEDSFREIGNYTLYRNTKRDGYNFSGWYFESDFSGEPVKEWYAGDFTEDVTVYAKWELIEYTITYDANGGTCPENNPTKYSIESGEVTLKDATKDYYDFLGWFIGSNCYTTVSYANYKRNFEFTAKYTPIVYNIEYRNLNGVTMSSSTKTTYTVESSGITLKDLSKKGYVFDGWYLDEGYIKKVTEISSGSHGDVTLYAKWSKRTDMPYTVEHVREGISRSEMETLYGTTLDYTNAAAKDYEGFTVQDFEQVQINPENESTKVTINYKRNNYTITYVTNGGNEIPAITVAYNKDLGLYSNSLKKERKGYTFDGFVDEEGNSASIPRYMPAKNLTLYLTWKPVNYSLNYNGFSDDSNKEYFTIENNVVLRTDLTRSGYDFTGWRVHNYSTGEDEEITGWNAGEFFDYLDNYGQSTRVTLYGKFIPSEVDSGTVTVVEKTYSDIEVEDPVLSDYSVTVKITKVPEAVSSSSWRLNSKDYWVDEVQKNPFYPKNLSQGNHTLYIEFTYINSETYEEQIYSATFIINKK